jgi:hypothetical protein
MRLIDPEERSPAMPALRSIRPKMKIHKSVMCEVSGKKTPYLRREGGSRSETEGFLRSFETSWKETLRLGFLPPAGSGWLKISSSPIHFIHSPTAGLRSISGRPPSVEMMLNESRLQAFEDRIKPKQHQFIMKNRKQANPHRQNGLFRGALA